MGATIYAYWPDMTQKDEGEGPDLFNGPRPWLRWVQSIWGRIILTQSMRDLGCHALLRIYPGKIKPKTAEWFTPDELEQAALTLINAVKSKDRQATNLLHRYAKYANHADRAEQEFIQDLSDMAGFARLMRNSNVDRFALGIDR